jgi:hypothetical protein
LGKLNKYAKLSPKVRYSEKFKELEPARHSLSNNNQSLDIGGIKPT